MYRDEIFLKLNKHTGFNKHTGVVDFAQKQKNSGKIRKFQNNSEKIRKIRKNSEKFGKIQKNSEKNMENRKKYAMLIIVQAKIIIQAELFSKIY